MLKKFSFVSLWLPWVFFVGFGGQGLRYTFGWLGFGLIAAVTVGVSCFLYRHSFSKIFERFPKSLLLFVTFCGLSFLWSHYRLETLLGFSIQLVTVVMGFLVACTYSWGKIVSALALSFQFLLGLSLLLELWVTIFVKEPLFPFVDGVEGFFWVNDSLFTGGPIQGFVGNRNLLAFVALLGLTVFVARLFINQGRKFGNIFWVGVCVSVMFLTRSATITVSVFTLVVLVFLVLWMRSLVPSKHKYLYYFGGGFLLLMLAVFVVFSSTLFGLVGRDDDLSGRTTIWLNVLRLVEQEPLLGWGWVSYWVPWREPFVNLAVFDNTTFLHAHNALLDVVFQTGVIGGVLALCVAVIYSVQVWKIAVYPPKFLVPSTPYSNQLTFLHMVPLLLMASLLIQSLTESRLLLEGNWLLFVIICCKTFMDRKVKVSV